MKQLKKPTWEQRKVMEQWHIDPREWLVERDTPEVLRIVHRYSDKTIKVIPKG